MAASLSLPPGVGWPRESMQVEVSVDVPEGPGESRRAADCHSDIRGGLRSRAEKKRGRDPAVAREVPAPARGTGGDAQASAAAPARSPSGCGA